MGVKFITIGGHDPTGGAGVTADIEVAAAFGEPTGSVVTAITDQTMSQVKAVHPVPVEQGADCLRSILAEFDISVVKLGLIPNGEWAAMLVKVLPPNVNLVVDPILASGGTDKRVLVNDEVLGWYRSHILPRATLATPNLHELMQITQGYESDLPVKNMCKELINSGCKAVLATGNDSALQAGKAESEHLLVTPNKTQSWQQKVYPVHFHGSGCTLASAIAVSMIQQESLIESVEAGLEYTGKVMQASYDAYRDAHLPRRGEGGGTDSVYLRPLRYT